MPRDDQWDALSAEGRTTALDDRRNARDECVLARHRRRGKTMHQVTQVESRHRDATLREECRQLPVRRPETDIVSEKEHDGARWSFAVCRGIESNTRATQ